MRSPPSVYFCRPYFWSLVDLIILYSQLRPDADFSEELGPPVIRGSWKTEPELSSHKTSTSLPTRQKGSPLRSNVFPTSRSAGTPRSDTDLSSDDYTSSDSEQVGELSLSRGMKRLTNRGSKPTQDHLSSMDNQVRFYGKSSCLKLIKPTRKLRDQHVNRMIGGEECSYLPCDSAGTINTAALRRPEFWTTPPVSLWPYSGP